MMIAATKKRLWVKVRCNPSVDLPVNVAMATAILSASGRIFPRTMPSISHFRLGVHLRTAIATMPCIPACAIAILLFLELRLYHAVTIVAHSWFLNKVGAYPTKKCAPDSQWSGASDSCFVTSLLLRFRRRLCNEWCRQFADSQIVEICSRTLVLGWPDLYGHCAGRQRVWVFIS